MKNRSNTKKAIAAGVWLSSSIGAPFAHAAGQNNPPAGAKPKMQQVVVTGSNVPVDPDKVAVSVVAVDAEQMAKAVLCRGLS